MTIRWPALDPKQARAAELQKLVDRKLLVQQAKEDGLDKSPEFINQQRRGDRRPADQHAGLAPGEHSAATVGRRDREVRGEPARDVRQPGNLDPRIS